ncbi:MAG: signal peptidase II [Candidatus Woesearchaeota archaeon]
MNQSKKDILKESTSKKSARTTLKKISAQKKEKKTKDENPRSTGYYSIIIFLIILILDRLTKIWAVSLDKPIDLGFLELVYVTNTGAGFSILSGQNVMLAWLAVIALGIILFYKEHFPKIGFLLISTGIIGNLIDRIIYGYVIDFINFKFWPVFNISDSLIFLGVVYTIYVWIKNDKEYNAKNDLKKKRNSTIKNKNKKFQ